MAFRKTWTLILAAVLISVLCAKYTEATPIPDEEEIEEEPEDDEAARFKLKLPKVNIPKPNIKIPKPNFNIPKPNFNLPKPNFNIPKPNFNIKNPFGSGGPKFPALKPGSMPTPTGPNWKSTLANSLIQNGISTAFIVPQTALTSWAQGQFAPLAQPGQSAAAPTQETGAPGMGMQPGMGMPMQPGIVGQDPATGKYIYFNGAGYMLVDPSAFEAPAAGPEAAAPAQNATETKPAA